MNHQSIAIDGPSGAGKSTLAKRLAQELGFFYVDTGAIYRTVGLAARRQGIDPSDAANVEAMLPGLTITMGYGKDGLQHMFLNGEDVTQAIRENEISACASKVAAIPAVRDFLLEMQRKTAREHDVIMDGRDIGTVVLPQADVKIFLTADPKERAMRRYKELVAKGSTADYDTVLREVQRRDYNDSHRAAAPLCQAEDAWLCDTTDLTLEGVIQAVVEHIRQKSEGAL